MPAYCVGDCHGNFDGLMQAIERSPFDPEHDMLISLGDVVDGWSQTKQVIDYLLTLPNFQLIRGNHDSSRKGCAVEKYGWFLLWAIEGAEIPLWWSQGGYYSALSYDFDHKSVPQSHIDLLMSAPPYYIDAHNNLYVHGGFKPHVPIEKQDPEYLMWDRDLVYAYGRGYAKGPVEGYNRVFLGHTSTQAIKNDMGFTDPIINYNVIALDTGGGWNGKITIMNVETLEYWQSDKFSRE